MVARELIGAGQRALTIGARPLAVSTLVDETGSILTSKLTEPIRNAMVAFEERLAQNPANRMRRATFNASRRFIGGSHALLPMNSVLIDPFGGHYSPSGTTHLDLFLLEEIVSLLLRYRRDTAKAYTHLLLVTTDGLNEGPDRAEEIRHLMAAVRAEAEKSGGVRSSRIVVWYAGAGLTRADHVEVATRRYNIPEEWVLHVPATPQGIEEMGTRIVDSVTSMHNRGETRIV